MYENIERIKSPSREVFINEYLLKQKPVIITDLFEGQPISQISSLEVARKQLGEMPVIVQEGHEEYFVRMLRGLLTSDFSFVDIGKEKSTVNGYLAMVEKDPNTRLVCAEVPRSMIDKVEASYSIPDYCKPDAGELDEYTSMLWLGNVGNYTHLHYDADYKNIFQYQLWGAKRVVLVSPSESRKLLPLRNNSASSPEGLKGEDNDAFVRYVNGYQAVVRTGETLFMPAMMWHYFEYLDTSMALTMRFRRNKYVRFMSENLHIDYHLQGIVFKFINERAIGAEHLKAYAELEAAFDKPFDNPSEKGKYMQDTYERIYSWFCKDYFQGDLARPFLREIKDAIRNVDILAGQLYSGERRAA
ncbi:cupin-like domain-containing protein [Hyalangium versicolor]|uniref:cupin-like domain-containing protein n=1 Tax=Hyalangium versicolor TaxID=2861190 RepID=UPI001CCB443F|nr:cupin-like domain-containing protein [Hyalangium versicolor]